MDLGHYVARREAVDIDEISFGYRTVTLLSPSALTAQQAGYEGAGWSPTWLVIATEDELGDPIFAELDSPALPVYTAAHGEGTWEPVRIADSFGGFVAALREVQALAAGRANPVELEENPLPDDARERVVARIEELNPKADFEFWETWLEE